MVDRLSREQRSSNMGRIRSKDTRPELTVRRILHALGLRYRLHAKDLPGKPDIVFRGRRKLIFVHGCYWHGHGCKRGGSGAKSNTAYWGPKITKNQARDAKHLQELSVNNWLTLVVWECETLDREAITNKLRSFLDR